MACFIKLVCRAARKPFVVDEFKTDEMIATGKASPDDIKVVLDEHGIRENAWRPDWADASLRKWMLSAPRP